MYTFERLWSATSPLQTAKFGHDLSFFVAGDIIEPRNSFLSNVWAASALNAVSANVQIDERPRIVYGVRGLSIQAQNFLSDLSPQFRR
jgi:hypothetical protein